MTPLYIESVGLVSEGLVGFEASIATLKGGNYQPAPLEKYKPQVLPPNERRRATELVRLSFQAAEDALSTSGFDASALATVFSSSGGDYFVLDSLCTSIAHHERMLSPTLFHNSVHNAAAGYWMIGAKSQHNSISLAAFDHSFGAGLLEACTLLVSDTQPVLLVVYDAKPPKLIAQKRPVRTPFASAYVLTHKPTEQSLASITLKAEQLGDLSRPSHSAFKDLFLDNPAARALPFIELLAKQQAGEINASLPQGNVLRINIAPC